MSSLAAVLIVRNESERLAACLASLSGVVDAVYVYDTGSTDDSVVVANDLGARVSTGDWPESFAAARNAALDNCTEDWVLSVDADEIVDVHSLSLRAFLRDSDVDVFKVQMTIAHDDAPYDIYIGRLFRRAKVQWAGRVHEQLVSKAGVIATAELPAPLLHLNHSGYATEDQRAQKAQRNADLAQKIVADSSSSAIDIARAYVDLGRSYVSVGELQKAADAFEKVRSDHEGTPEWLEATDFLTRLVIAEEMPETALALIQQLSVHGVSTQYCDWLASQVLVQQERFSEAAELISGVDLVVDTSGRKHSAAALMELKSVLQQLAALNPPK